MEHKTFTYEVLCQYIIPFLEVINCKHQILLGLTSDDVFVITKTISNFEMRAIDASRFILSADNLKMV